MIRRDSCRQQPKVGGAKQILVKVNFKMTLLIIKNWIYHEDKTISKFVYMQHQSFEIYNGRKEINEHQYGKHHHNSDNNYFLCIQGRNRYEYKLVNNVIHNCSLIYEEHC